MPTFLPSHPPLIANMTYDFTDPHMYEIIEQRAAKREAEIQEAQLDFAMQHHAFHYARRCQMKFGAVPAEVYGIIDPYPPKDETPPAAPSITPTEYTHNTISISRTVDELLRPIADEAETAELDRAAIRDREIEILEQERERLLREIQKGGGGAPWDQNQISDHFEGYVPQHFVDDMRHDPSVPPLHRKRPASHYDDIREHVRPRTEDLHDSRLLSPRASDVRVSDPRYPGADPFLVEPRVVGSVVDSRFVNDLRMGAGVGGDLLDLR
eukprot:c5634_g1_i1.p1 GENE.c5634_g1_i1~~c5634_g1_i1.p1  ORF type:complete len:306 (+),score=65.66 c5634_g1_i1:117-920(+)